MAIYEHLPLKRVEGLLERRKHPFGSAPTRDNAEHGKRISTDIDKTVADFEALPSVEGVDPALILKVRSDGPIDEDHWRKLGLVVLSVDGDNSVVLFASDKLLKEFRARVEAYQGELPLDQKNPSYNGLVAPIESVSLLTAEDRIGQVYRRSTHQNVDSFVDGQTYLIDVQLHRPPDESDSDLFLYRVEVTITKFGGVLLSSYRGSSMLLARIEVPGEGVRALLELPEVASVDAPPTPDLAISDLGPVTLDAVEPGSPPPQDAVVIGIIDSGVNFGHPLLASTESLAISLDPRWSVSDGRGHGTQVASIAAFGDIVSRYEQQNFDAQFRIASARVLNDDGSFAKEKSLPAMMDEAVRTLHSRVGCRIFNISLGDELRPYLGGKVDPWAATLDTLARELDVLIIVSAGNRNDLTSSFGDGIVAAYPHFLTEVGSRIIEPATAVNVLTVGAVAHGNGLDDADGDLVGVRPICGLNEPAPFTRTGPGIRGMTKPELVDSGGNAVWDGPSNKIVTGSQKASAGIWAFSHLPIETLFCSRSGTSMSAPNVAYKAALLLTNFPKASANLLRALLGIAATIPSAITQRAGGLSGKAVHATCGHGVANAKYAASSEDDRVVLYAEASLPLDHFAVFEVPIPAEFQTVKGEKEIRVSLAFDPIVRHTRADYVGVTMGWRLLRGASEAEVFDHFRKWTKEEGKPPEFPNKFVCSSDPGPQLRETGTLQVGTYTGKVDISDYGDKYFVAVWCGRRWAPDTVKEQNFAICVQLRHRNVNTLYNLVKQPIKV
jgi:subtilisin family serine protease